MSSQPAAARIDPSLVESILRFCNARSIDLESSHSNAVRAIVGMCQRFISHKELLSRVLPGTFVDWAYVDAIAQSEPSLSVSDLLATDGDAAAPARKNPIGGVNAWIDLLEHVSFPDLGVQDSAIQALYPPLWCVLSSIRSSRAYDPMARAVCQKASADAPAESPAEAPAERVFSRVVCSKPGLLSMSDVCKLYIAVNLEGVTSRDIIDRFVACRVSGHSHHITSNLMTALADQRHSADTYLETMCFLLDKMAVDGATLARHIAHFRETRKSQQSAWAVKYVEASKTRTSMRDVARRVNSGGATMEYGRHAGTQGGGGAPSVASASSRSLASASASLVGTSGATTFEDFCSAVGFPVSMSRLLRLRCFLLCCQAHVMDHAAHAQRLVPRDVASSISAHPIAFPSVPCLCTAIESLAMNIGSFPQLDEFRRRGLASFALNQRRGLTLTQILHLYVAAYQRRDVWKACWKRIYPVMSSQIARDVEAFTGGVGFAVEPFITILKTSTPFIV